MLHSFTKIFLFICIIVPLSTTAYASYFFSLTPEESHLVADDQTVSFMAYDTETGKTYILEGSDIKTRHSPWSSFKIPNALIALEYRTLKNLTKPVPHNPQERPAAEYWSQIWTEPQTLEKAFKNSTVWYFQDIATQIPNQIYRDILTQWHYGNANAPDDDDSFWLHGPLKISVEEQISFLDRLANKNLDISEESYKNFILISHVHTYKNGTALHGKTGGGTREKGNFNGSFEGWYVGFVLYPDKKPTVFTLYTKAETWSQLSAFRKDFSITLLKKLGFLPND